MVRPAPSDPVTRSLARIALQVEGHERMRGLRGIAVLDVQVGISSEILYPSSHENGSELGIAE